MCVYKLLDWSSATAFVSQDGVCSVSVSDALRQSGSVRGFGPPGGPRPSRPPCPLGRAEGFKGAGPEAEGHRGGAVSGPAEHGEPAEGQGGGG